MTSQHFGLGYHSDNEIKDTLPRSCIMYPVDKVLRNASFNDGYSRRPKRDKSISASKSDKKRTISSKIYSRAGICKFRAPTCSFNDDCPSKIIQGWTRGIKIITAKWGRGTNVTCSDEIRGYFHRANFPGSLLSSGIGTHARPYELTYAHASANTNKLQRVAEPRQRRNVVTSDGRFNDAA